MFESIDFLSIAALAVTLAGFVILAILRARKTGFTTLVLLGLSLGIAIGIVFDNHLEPVTFFGDLYIQIITAIVAPLIFISILSAVTSLGSTAQLKTIGLSSTFWLLLSNLIAIIFTLGVTVAIGLGKGATLESQDGADTLTGLVKPLDQVFLGLFPKNLAGDFVSNNIVPIILFAILFAVAFLVANKKKDPQLSAFKNVIDGSKKVIITAVGFVIELTPYAVLALAAAMTATALARIETVIALVSVLVVSLLVTFFDAYVINGVLLRVFADVNPFRWFKYLTPAQYTAFTTQSSVGTLPLTMSTLVKKVGVPENVASFTAPIGTTIGMPGCAGIWPIIVAVFSINALGLDYSIWDYLTLIVLCLLVSLGTAGVPGTAIITATAVLTAVGLPVEILVMLIPISAVAGTASTMANVTTAATAATIVARRLGTLNVAVFNGTAKPDVEPQTVAVDAAAASTNDTTATVVLPVTADTGPLRSRRREQLNSEIQIPEGVPVGQCELPGTRQLNETR